MTVALIMKHVKIFVDDLSTIIFGVTVSPVCGAFDWLIWILKWLGGWDD